MLVQRTDKNNVSKHFEGETLPKQYKVSSFYGQVQANGKLLRFSGEAIYCYGN